MSTKNVQCMEQRLKTFPFPQYFLNIFVIELTFLAFRR